MSRMLLVKLHRYLGLALAVLLAVLGITGSIIVFDPELDAWLNPDLFALEQPGGTPLPAAELIRRVEASDRRIEAHYLTLSEVPRKASVAYVSPRTDPATGAPYRVDYDEVFIDPVTGVVTGRRLWGECCFQARNFVPFMYKLHNRLLLPIDTGRPLLGVVSALWLALLVVGAWLTWPVSGRPWRDWRRAWRPRSGRSSLQTTLSWHRTGGLWLWPVLAGLAFTGVVLGFEDQTRTLVNILSPLSEPPAASSATTLWERPNEVRLGARNASARPPLSGGLAVSLPGNGRPPGRDRISATKAIAAARTAVRTEGFHQPLTYVSHSADSGLYRIRFGSAYAAGLQEVTAYVSAASGDVLGITTARGNSVGDLVMNTAQPLHAGRIGGLAGRILVCLGGIAVAGLSITGVVMWGLRRFRSGGRAL